MRKPIYGHEDAGERGDPDVQTRKDHAGYIESWLRALRNDKRAIFMAATKASQATDYLLALQAGRF